MKIAYFDCFSGISGDMTIAAFLDAGLSLRTLACELKKLGLKGYELTSSRVKRAGLSGTKFDCVTAQKAHVHRTLKEILGIIDKSALDARPRNISKAIFENIGLAEAKVHGTKDASSVWLHELGSVDSIIDIVGCAIAIDELGIDEVYSSRVRMGGGFTRSAHGILPVPAPASMELLKDAAIEMSGAVEAELVTPTGAGILKTLAGDFGAVPPMKVQEIGYGAGARDLGDMPNMLRVLIGESQTAFKTDRVLVVETNIDDMSPQNFEYLFERLFKAGALDVYITNIQMKKSRPAFKLTALAEPKDADRIASAIFAETTSIGLRFYEAGRFKLDRKMVKVSTRYGDVKVKVSGASAGAFTASPEYDDCVRLARAKKIPLKAVYDEAKQAVKL